jgi:murein DD-endopeptidase MepM/ murein hydrolase activator NlpD
LNQLQELWNQGTKRFANWRRAWPECLLAFLIVVGLAVRVAANPAASAAPVAAPAPAAPTVSVPIVPASPAPTNGLTELQQQQRQIEAQRSNIDQKRDQIKQQQKSAQTTLKSAQRQVKATSAEISQNEQRLNQENQRLKKFEQKLAQAEKVYSVQQTATVARLRFLQRQGGSYGLAVLLQSKNLNDFLDRRYQIRQLYRSDRQILAKLKANTDAITKQRREVEAQKNQVALITQQLLAQKLESQQEAEQQQALINRLRLDHKALEAAELQLAKDSDNIAILIQQRLGVKNPGVGWRQGKGLLSYPCDGELTSGFGYRMHPILGYSKFHSGLDFGADYGTPIRAAAPGKVLFASWYGGYGQAVILDHGNGVTTLYGHTEEIYVKEGQTVQRGTPIAAVGSTGFSTGPHLHFEVRVGGNPVDPQEYL